MKSSNSLHFHPGQHLNDILEIRNISLSTLSKMSNLREETLLEFLTGNMDVNDNIAIGLEKALKIDKSFWYNLQRIYNRDQK